jgi:hypothetical protein
LSLGKPDLSYLDASLASGACSRLGIQEQSMVQALIKTF